MTSVILLSYMPAHMLQPCYVSLRSVIFTDPDLHFVTARHARRGHSTRNEDSHAQAHEGAWMAFLNEMPLL